MSCTVVFLAFGVQNAKYILFKTSDTSTLILG